MASSEPGHAGRQSSRGKLIDAALKLVSEQGLQQVTIDAVAAAAGVTKGGLIYHFKTRDELLGAMLERMMGELNTRIGARKEHPGGTSIRELVLALADESFDMPEDQRRILSNMLAASSTYPHLMGPAQSHFSNVYGELAGSGPHAGRALLLSAALDGFTFLELLNLHQFTPQQKKAMRRAVLEMARELP